MKIVKMFTLAGALLAELCPGQLNITNNTNTTMTVKLTVIEKTDAKGVQAVNIEHELELVVVQPNAEITINLDDEKFANSTLLVQGLIVTAPPITALMSNKCIISDSNGDVTFIQKKSKLICTVVQVEKNYRLSNHVVNPQ